MCHAAIVIVKHTWCMCVFVYALHANKHQTLLTSLTHILV